MKERQKFVAAMRNEVGFEVQVFARAGRLVLHKRLMTDSHGQPFETPKNDYVIAIAPQGLKVLPGRYQIASIKAGKALVERLAALRGWPPPGKKPTRALYNAVLAACEDWAKNG